MSTRALALLLFLMASPALAQIDPGWRVTSFNVLTLNDGAKVSWNPATSAKGLPVSYTLTVYPSANGSNASLTLASQSTAATLASKDIRSMAATAGVKSGAPLQLYGAVTSTDGVTTLNSPRQSFVVMVP